MRTLNRVPYRPPGRDPALVVDMSDADLQTLRQPTRLLSSPQAGQRLRSASSTEPPGGLAEYVDPGSWLHVLDDGIPAVVGTFAHSLRQGSAGPWNAPAAGGLF